MGDFNSSDCSWKKMVIAKANNEWISTIKLEHGEEVNPANTREIDSGHEQLHFLNIKREREDTAADNYLAEDPIAVPQEMDGSISLLLPRRRRKASGLKNETPDERATRLAKMSAYAAQRLANETPEQRATRLKRMSEYAAKRLSQETSEQRAKRLARMSAYAAKRLASETPEQRQARLARMSAYAARRQAMKKGSSPSTSEDLHSSFNYNLNLMPNQS